MEETRVVIDPADVEQVNRLTVALFEAITVGTGGHPPIGVQPHSVAAALRAYARGEATR